MLEQPEQNFSGEAPEKLRPLEIKTAKGSIYKYLEDGRTQRSKEATKELHEPQDMLFFIPPWEKVETQAKQFYPEIFKGIENQVQYEQVLLEYAQLPGKTIRALNESGSEIDKNSVSNKILLAFIDKNNPDNNFTLPVSKTPQIGWLTFDTRKYLNEKGEVVRERHIGHPVTEIKYQ